MTILQSFSQIVMYLTIDIYQVTWLNISNNSKALLHIWVFLYEIAPSYWKILTYKFLTVAAGEGANVRGTFVQFQLSQIKLFYINQHVRFI